MHDSITKVLQNSYEEEKLRQERANKVNRDLMKDMEQEDNDDSELWCDPYGIQYLFTPLEYCYYTECWDCDSECICGLKGSVWFAYKPQIYVNDTI